MQMYRIKKRPREEAIRKNSRAVLEGDQRLDPAGCPAAEHRASLLSKGREATASAFSLLIVPVAA